ncbi:MAG: ester cyclase [Flavobacteriaceae bacterium]|nr:ester cyclase [Flavobacteriaceae bacterium]
MKRSIIYQTYLRANIIILACLMGFFWLMASCTNSLDSKAQKNKEIVMKSFEVVANGDYEGMDMYIAADLVRHCQATPDLIIESLDAFKEFIRNDRKSIPDQKLNVKMLVAEGDLVAFWATYTGTHTGQMGPFPPTGKSVELDFSGVHRLENGKVVETWVTWDNVTILSQLGLFPPKPIE